MPSRNKRVLIYVHSPCDGLASEQSGMEWDSDTLVGFPFLVGSPVHSRLKNLVFTLKFIFKFILKVLAVIPRTILHNRSLA
jgi:hypothetical protein